jgi:hypothetical protein
VANSLMGIGNNDDVIMARRWPEGMLHNSRRIGRACLAVSEELLCVGCPLRCAAGHSASGHSAWEAQGLCRSPGRRGGGVPASTGIHGQNRLIVCK